MKASNTHPYRNGTPDHARQSYVWGVICGRKGRVTVRSKSSGWKVQEAFKAGVVAGVQVALRAKLLNPSLP